MSGELTHIDSDGSAHMVDVGNKADTDRTAIAKGEVHLLESTVSLIRKGLMKKGDVLSIAQIAGIMAAKRTSELIPLCHPIPIHQVEVIVEVNNKLPGIEITATVRTTGKTGVEMEALTAVSVAALTVYDMVKAVEKTGRIQNIRLIEKHGGKSGDIYNS
jgi:cyclic pyranopterin monophosphate synthase